ncbi:MAG: hypothetical protein HOV73_08855 [Streptomyces sp.]|nr:hypothetical protein [Streptomyces sp.]NUR40177.1 hypothetical protein [Streptomyces sp.]NUR64171.1 hypothetical protein [Streptomyces sp.]
MTDEDAPRPLLLHAGAELPWDELPDGLAERLRAWYRARPADGFTSRPALRKHVRQGVEAAQELARWLGPEWEVRYRDERHRTEKYVCWGCGRLYWDVEAHGSPAHPRDFVVHGEYRWYPLRADGFGDFAPDDPTAALALPEELVGDLNRWSAQIDAAMDLWLQDRDDEAFRATHERLDGAGRELTLRIAPELGPGRTVRYGGLW